MACTIFVCELAERSRFSKQTIHITKHNFIHEYRITRSWSPVLTFNTLSCIHLRSQLVNGMAKFARHFVAQCIEFQRRHYLTSWVYRFALAVIRNTEREESSLVVLSCCWRQLKWFAKPSSNVVRACVRNVRVFVRSGLAIRPSFVRVHPPGYWRRRRRNVNGALGLIGSDCFALFK